MKFAVAGSLLALAAVGSAQLDKIPSCALQCFLGPLGSDGCAQLTDFKCHCEKGSELLGKVQPCVQGACSAADQQAAIAAVQQTCSAAGVPINIPNPGASSAAAPASSAAAPASSAAAPASSAAQAVSSAAASASAAVSSAASKASSVLASATANGTTPTRPTSAPSQFTGGASLPTQAAAVLGAAALAMLAL